MTRTSRPQEAVAPGSRGGGDVVNAPSQNPVSEAAATLTDIDIGVVVVTDSDGGVSGILSERDVSRGVTQHGGDLVHKQVGDLMTRRVIACTPDHGIVDAFSLMVPNGIRHVPVTRDGDVLGIADTHGVMDVWLKALEEENLTPRRLLSGLAQAGNGSTSCKGFYASLRPLVTAYKRLLHGRQEYR